MRNPIAGFVCFFISTVFCLVGSANEGKDYHLRVFPPKIEDGVYPRHYRPDRTVDYKHMLLDIQVFMAEQRLEGSVRYTFDPIHGQVDYINLDARNMSIRAVETNLDIPMKWTYSNNTLQIQFNRDLPTGREGELLITYSVSEPENGMYFTDSQHVDPQNPDQLFTLGEPTGGSDWFPAPDYPNDRLQTEIRVKVPRQFTTLSNGLIIESTEDGDWRTDHWRQEMPHVVYLVSLVVGKFDIVTDQWRGIDVQYYVEEGLAEHARPSMGKTVDMLDFFSDYLDYPYPFEKYAQVAVRDFRAGGMEHTTATTLFEYAVIDQEARLDVDYDGLIAHELIHQWFGDLVTCESWPHIWLNESFATLFDALWHEHAKGQDEYLLEIKSNLDSYVAESRSYTRAIVTNEFNDPMKMFDRHTYPKGSVVLHMLRRQLGDELFQQSIRTYLKDNAPGLVDTDDLMEAIEAVTGKPMDRFFEQWVFRPGHPKLKVSHEWDAERKQVKLRIQQTQEMKEGEPAFAFPLYIEVPTAEGVVGKTIEVTKKEESATIETESAPLTLWVDPDLSVLMELEHEKAQDMLLYDLKHGPTIIVRMRAAEALSKEKATAVVEALAYTVRSDPFRSVQIEAAKALGGANTEEALEALISLADHPHPKTRRAVIDALGEFYQKERASETLLERLQSDPSILVTASAARAIGKVGIRDTTGALLSALDRKSHREEIRRAALDALVSLKAPEVFEELREYAEDPHGSMLRRAAIRALGTVGKEHNRFENEALDALLKYLSSRSTLIRTSAVGGLQSLGNKDAIPHLQRVSNHDVDAEIREAAKRAIEEINRDRGSEITGENSRKILDLEKENENLKERLDQLEQTVKILQEQEK